MLLMCVYFPPFSRLFSRRRDIAILIRSLRRLLQIQRQELVLRRILEEIRHHESTG